MKSVRKYGPIIIFILSAIAIILAIVILLKNKIAFFHYLEDKKESLEVLTSILTAIILILGSIFSYFRFFKGRTFSEKLRINYNIKVIKVDKKDNLLFLELILINTGSIAIWNPVVELQLEKLKKDEKEIIGLKISDETENLETIIEPQGQLNIHHKILLDKDFYALTCELGVKSERKNKWIRTFTVPNQKGYEYFENI